MSTNVPSVRGSRRRRGWIVIAVILIVAAAFLGYAVLFVVPFPRSYSFEVPQGACTAPTAQWRLPDGSQVSGEWTDHGSGAERVNISTQNGVNVYEGSGFNGSYTFSAAGAFSFGGGSTTYVVEAWPVSLPVAEGCTIFPTVTFSGTFTGPLL